MISILVVGILLVCGILYLVLPEYKLVNKDKIKPGQSAKDIVKQSRRAGIFFIGLAIFFFFVNVL